MPQQELDGAQIARLFVNLSRLCPSYGMCSVDGIIKSDARHPFPHIASVLSGGDMRPFREMTRGTNTRYWPPHGSRELASRHHGEAEQLHDIRVGVAFDLLNFVSGSL
jgi:hypothetical protein